MNELIVALLIGIITGAAGFYTWYLKMQRIQRFIKSSGIAESYKALKIERDELHRIVKNQEEELKIKNAEVERYRRAIVAFGERDKRTREIEEELKNIKNFQIWQFGRLFAILNKNGIKLTNEEWSELTPPD